MGEPIERIDWNAGRRSMVVSYSGRAPVEVLADELVAERLADDAGLVLVPAAPDSLRWVHPASAGARPRGYGPPN